jgi:hypothetical protein
MIQLGNRSGPALRYLWTFSELHDHPQAGRAFDRDRNCLNTELLGDEWPWSSGERVLIDLARAIAQGSGGCYVGELTFLDEHHRQVATEALSIWLNGEHDTVSV